MPSNTPGVSKLIFGFVASHRGFVQLRSRKPASEEQEPERCSSPLAPFLKVHPPKRTSQASMAGRKARASRIAAKRSDSAGPLLRLCAPPLEEIPGRCATMAASGTSSVLIILRLAAVQLFMRAKEDLMICGELVSAGRRSKLGREES